MYKDQQSVLTMTVRGGTAPINIAIQNGPDFCSLQDDQLYCMPNEVGPFNVTFSVSDRLGNSMRQTISFESIVNPDPNINQLVASSSRDSRNVNNSNMAHNQALKQLPTRCKLASVNQREYYSDVQVVVMLSASHQ